MLYFTILKLNKKLRQEINFNTINMLELIPGFLPWGGTKMGYTIYDLIEKLIDIEKSALQLYIKIEEEYRTKSRSISIVTKAIAKQEEKHIEYYEKLKIDLEKDLKNENIEVYLYDKVAKLLIEFKMYIDIPKIDVVQDLIKYSLEFEKNNIALLLDIQGRLLEKEDDVNNNVYKVISNIINEEQGHKKMFETLIVS